MHYSSVVLSKPLIDLIQEICGINEKPMHKIGEIVFHEIADFLKDTQIEDAFWILS